MNDGDESRRRLNYYSRSSPKKRKLPLQHTLHSPLLPPPSAPRTLRHHSRSRYSTNSPQSSFRIEIMEVSRSSANDEILIEDFPEQEILIRDEEPDEAVGSQREVSAFQVQKRDDLQQKFQDKEITPRMKGTDIRIEDDQNQQAQQIGPPRLPSTQDFIKIQNQQQQTMNRQFTFGQELAQSQKAEIQVFPLTIPEQEQQEDTSFPQSPSQEQETQLCVSNLEYGEGRVRPELDLALVEQYQQGHDYQSPKFNVLPHRRSSDKWITVEDIHLLTSPDKREKILIQEEPKHIPSRKSSARTTLSLRPYGRSIALLSEVLGLVPANLAQVYEQMHRKLVGDQIQAQERQERQEMQMKTLRMLLQVQRQRIHCDSFLLASKGSALQERIEINKLIIQSLLRLISQKD